MPPQAPVAYRLLDYSGRAKAEKYTAKSGGGPDPSIVPRQRAAHAGKLRGDLQSVKSAAERIQLSQELADYEEDAGIHIEIRGKSGCELLLEPLDAPRFGISLENVRIDESVLPGGANETTMIATVFVKHGKLEYLVKRVEAYSAAKTRTDKSGKVIKMDFAPFITSIESIGIAAVEAFWTSRHPLPDFDVETWWELWVRAGTSIAERNRHEEAVLSEANRLGLQRKQGKLILPEHSVFLFKTTRRVLSAARTAADSTTRLFPCTREYTVHVLESIAKVIEVNSRIC
jgi:hypothetical protein